MPGRFSGEIPKLSNQPWNLDTQRNLETYLRRIRDGMTNLQLTPDDPTTVAAGESSSEGSGPAPALDDHTHDIDVSGTPGTVATVSAQGTSSGLAQTNHTHRLGIVTTKGDILVHNGTDPIRLPVGSDGQLLAADSSTASGLSWQKWVWQDLRAPATSLRLGAGGADTNNGSLIFRNGQDDVVFATFQMPHGFNPSTVYPHVHWYKATSAAGTVAWQVRWVIADRGDVWGDITAESWTALSELTSDADTALLHARKGTSIDMSSYTDSAVIMMAIRRNSSGGGDTYGANAHLVEVDIHVQVASLGSDSL